LRQNKTEFANPTLHQTPESPAVPAGAGGCAGELNVRNLHPQKRSEIVLVSYQISSDDEAKLALSELTPSKFNYKVDKDDEYLGFIAEDVPDLVATKDRKGMSPMDIVAVLTKVVQKQQEENVVLTSKFQQQQKENAALNTKLAAIMNRLEALEK
jgi:hypothetical protein